LGEHYQGTMHHGQLIPAINPSYQGQVTAGTSIDASGKVTLSPEQIAYLNQQNAQVNQKNQQVRAFAKGGVIREPVRGVGQNTGDPYLFGEQGPETITPGTPQGCNGPVNQQQDVEGNDPVEELPTGLGR